MVPNRKTRPIHKYEQLKAHSKKTYEAYNNGDAAALVSLYTEDAVLVTDTGPIYGREAIEKLFAGMFQQGHYSDHLDKADRNSPHIIGTAGNEAWGLSHSEVATPFLNAHQQFGGPDNSSR